jgi:hypothetical protein
VPQGPKETPLSGGLLDPDATNPRSSKEFAVSDLLYVGLTIVVFAMLILLVKGVERFER